MGNVHRDELFIERAVVDKDITAVGEKKRIGSFFECEIFECQLTGKHGDHLSGISMNDFNLIVVADVVDRPGIHSIFSIYMMR